MPGRGLILCGAIAAGIVAAEQIRASVGPALAAGIVGVGFLLIAGLLHRRFPEPQLLDLLPKLRGSTVAFLLSGFVLVGFSLSAIRFHSLDHATSSFLSGRVVELRGRIVTDPESRGRSSVAIVRASAIGSMAVQERIELRWNSHELPRLGDEILTDVRLQKLDRTELFDQILYRKSVVARAAVLGPIHALGETKNPVIRASNILRSKMDAAAKRALNKEDAGLLMGLVIGDRRGISDKVEEEFRLTGLSHLTAVSGANVAMVVGALFVLLRAIRTSRRSQVALGLATVLFFAVVTRWEPSVMRACVMASLALGSFFFGRLSNPLSALGTAAAGLLLLDPFLVWSVAFQLSLAATAGILILSPWIRDHLKLTKLISEPLAITMGAQAFVVPLVALHFGSLSIVSLPANLIAAPLVPPATVIGLVGGALSLISDAAARLMLSLSGLPVALLRFSAANFALVPFATVGIFGVRWIQMAAGYLIGIAFFMRAVLGRRRSRLAALIGAVVLLFVAYVPVAASEPRGHMRITFFDVGQGDAALVMTPGGARILVDGGPDPTDVADRLLRMGIRRLDLVIFSHAHIDHVRGLEGVMRQIQVRAAIHPGVESYLVREVGDLDSSSDGEEFEIGDAIVSILGPDPDLRESASNELLGEGDAREGSALNDASLVVRIEWRGSCALFPGDLEEKGQERLVETHGGRITCEVLKAPHHGSAKLLETFVRAVDPKTTVLSVGRNSFGHPSRKAIGLFERVGSQVLRTDREGDVIVEVEGTQSARIRSKL